jgi:protein TonB
MLRGAVALVFSFALVSFALDTPNPDVQPPKLVTASKPDFGRCSKPKPGDKISVIVSLVVTTEGLPDNVGLEKSSGNACVDESAVTAVQKYRFQPATRNSIPMAVRLRVRVDFQNFGPGKSD